MIYWYMYNVGTLMCDNPLKSLLKGGGGHWPNVDSFQSNAILVIIQNVHDIAKQTFKHFKILWADENLISYDLFFLVKLGYMYSVF
jgi:hypothetical protein